MKKTYVLKAVALLGADIPAVEGLAELGENNIREKEGGEDVSDELKTYSDNFSADMKNINAGKNRNYDPQAVRQLETEARKIAESKGLKWEHLSVEEQNALKAEATIEKMK